MRVSSTVAALLAVVAVVAGCGEGRDSAGAPGPEQVAGRGATSQGGALAAAEAGVAGWTSSDSRFPRAEVVDGPRVVDVSSVVVSEDGTVVTARFTGASGVAGDPCRADYAAQPVMGPAAVALVVEEAFASVGERACSDVGYPREVEVVLPEPLGERTVVGLDGTPVAVDPAPPACTAGWTVDIAADFRGAADPEAALAEWLALDPSEHTAPEAGTPQTGWTADWSDRDDRVVYRARDLAVTVSRSTRGEWLVTTVDCLPPAQVAP